MHSTTIIRNSILNIVGQGIPIALSLIALPILLKNYGADQLGILFLVWMLFGSFALLDFGVGKAATKYVAEAMGVGDRGAIAQIGWSAAWFQLGIGVIAGGIMALLSLAAAESFLTIPEYLRGDVQYAMLLASSAIPFVLLSSHFMGLLEAGQHFAALNLIRMIFSIASLAAPLLGAVIGLSFTGVLFWVMFTRAAQALMAFSIVLLLVPEMREVASFKMIRLRLLLQFGGWVSLISLLAFPLGQLDRLLITSLLGIHALTSYSIPFDIMMRVMIVSQGVAQAVFPIFSALNKSDPCRAADIHTRATRYLLIFLSGPVCFTAINAHYLLGLWLGPDYERASATVLQVLGVGVVFNSVSMVSYTSLLGKGRPDLIVKAHLCEGLPYCLAAFLGVRYWGVVGSAAAWTGRVVADALLLTYLNRQVNPEASHQAFGENRPVLQTLAVLISLALGIGLFTERGEPRRLVLSGITCVGFAIVAWRHLLESSDRRAVLSLLSLRHVTTW